VGVDGVDQRVGDHGAGVHGEERASGSIDAMKSERADALIAFALP
jgi:hypothetical protein